MTEDKLSDSYLIKTYREIDNYIKNILYYFTKTNNRRLMFFI